MLSRIAKCPRHVTVGRAIAPFVRLWVGRSPSSWAGTEPRATGLGHAAGLESGGATRLRGAGPCQGGERPNVVPNSQRSNKGRGSLSRSLPRAASATQWVAQTRPDSYSNATGRCSDSRMKTACVAHVLRARSRPFIRAQGSACNLHGKWRSDKLPRACRARA
jgi:hypothetical protein